VAIIERKTSTGGWEREFTGNDVGEAFHQGLQEYGAQKFHEAWKRNESIGFEKLRNAHGEIEHVRADEAEGALASGFAPVSNPTMVVPDLPWHKDHVPKYGKTRYKYDRETGRMIEA